MTFDRLAAFPLSLVNMADRPLEPGPHATVVGYKDSSVMFFSYIRVML